MNQPSVFLTGIKTMERTSLQRKFKSQIAKALEVVSEEDLEHWLSEKHPGLFEKKLSQKRKGVLKLLNEHKPSLVKRDPLDVLREIREEI